MSIFILKWRGYCRWQYARATVLLPLAIRTALHGYRFAIRRAGAAMCSGWRPCAHTPCWRGYVLGLAPLRAYAAHVSQPNTAGTASGRWATPYVAIERRTYCFSSSLSPKIAIASSIVLPRLAMTRFVITSTCSRLPAIFPSLMPAIFPSFFKTFSKSFLFCFNDDFMCPDLHNNLRFKIRFWITIFFFENSRCIDMLVVMAKQQREHLQ